ncbi:MAG: hypothetical protein KDI03_21585, partial [Anaerolineae bacterium]|nr:hypothetical protein [Anaerolineae bacterium]
HTGPHAAWDEDLLDYTRRATALRSTYPVFSHGGFAVLQTSTDLVVYARHWQNQIAVVALNAGKDFVRLETPASGFAADGAIFQTVWGTENARVDNGILHGVAVPPRSGIALIGAV